MSKRAKIILSIVIILVVAGGSFYGGVLYGKNQKSAAAASGSFQAFRGSRAGAAGTAGTSIFSGDIIGKDSSSITLQLPNNSGSKIIFYSTATQIGKMTSGTPDDLTNGTSVSIMGTTNSDGSVTANSIQIRPAGQNRGQGAAPAQ